MANGSVLGNRGNCKTLSWVRFREMHRRQNGGIRFFLRISRKCAHMKRWLLWCADATLLIENFIQIKEMEVLK